jgi:broad specificity phosphatase PhoE
MASRFLYLVRHGEAAGEGGVLTAAGQEQARLTGERLATVLPSFARLVTSYTITERNEGAALAQAAIEEYAGVGEETAGRPVRMPCVTS